MKSTSLFLSLIACGQTTPEAQHQAPPLLQSDPSLSIVDGSIDFKASSELDLEAPKVTDDIDFPMNGTGEGGSDSNEPIMVCASSAAWTGWPEPESDDPDLEHLFSVSRISIFEHDDRHSALVVTGSAHKPDAVFGTQLHDDIVFHVDDGYLDIGWENASIMGWATQQDGTIFNGGGWGDIAAPIGDTSEPPPPCGFEVYISCWDPSDIQSPFEYDPKTGQCLDANQQTGVNYKPVEYIRETGDGECADLSWAMLSEGIPFDVDMDGWNLKGARLDFASLGFLTPESEANHPRHRLIDAQLEGADLSSLDAFNATISGTVDAHTQLPEMDCMVDNHGTVDCEG